MDNAIAMMTSTACIFNAFFLKLILLLQFSIMEKLYHYLIIQIYSDHMEKTYPARGDMTIMIHEKQNELTDINVALCSAGTI